MRPAEPIRVRVTVRNQSFSRENPREAFWAPYRESPSSSESDSAIVELERQFCRDFGGELRDALVQQASVGWRRLESDLFLGGFDDLRHFMLRRSDKEPYSLDALNRFLEYRQQMFRDSAPLRRAHERMVAAGSVLFTTRISGYSSLNFDIATGSFGQLATIFDDNFDAFRVFLDAFVPVAFGEVFSEDFANQLEFSVVVPRSVEEAFYAAVGGAQSALTPTMPSAATSPPAPTTSDTRDQWGARERAEYLWRLANGSLLVPVVLALAIMFYGFSILADIRRTQYEAPKPLLDHQLELLREDRLRMWPAQPTPTPAPSPTPVIAPPVAPAPETRARQ